MPLPPTVEIADVDTPHGRLPAFRFRREQGMKTPGVAVTAAGLRVGAAFVPWDAIERVDRKALVPVVVLRRGARLEGGRFLRLLARVQGNSVGIPSAEPELLRATIERYLAEPGARDRIGSADEAERLAV
jgi:hypothetical protein